jgi:hypothetical protein
MNESLKAVLELIIVLCVIVCIFFIDWGALGESGNLWLLAAAVLIGGASLTVLLRAGKWESRNRDKVPDFLGGASETFLERKGFCFRPTITVQDGHASLDIHYQNSFERRALVRIVSRPAVGFFLRRRKLPRTDIRFECGPAAYGTVHVPLPIPARYQGTLQKFDFSCRVKYPEGRGKRLRFRHGVRVGSVGFSHLCGHLIYFVAALGGILVISRPALCQFTLPQSVAQSPPDGAAIRVIEKWTLGGQSAHTVEGSLPAQSLDGEPPDPALFWHPRPDDVPSLNDTKDS